MKYVAAFRRGPLVRSLVKRIGATATRPWRIMEVCGGQTNTILRYGLDQALAPLIKFVHGPGCPVCVTPAETIDLAQDLAGRSGVVLGSFGDMLRVPGSERTLLDVKSAGGEITMLYSPLDALSIARARPECEVVFFGIGFETTAPLTALAILRAKEIGLENFSVLCAHVLIPPAIEAVLDMPAVSIDALLAPGHVCTVSGTSAYRSLAAERAVPIVVTGFEPADILHGVLEAVEMLEQGRADMTVAYGRAVTPGGNREARRLMATVFRPADRVWRGLGLIANSGLVIAREYERYDAACKFALTPAESDRDDGDPCGRVLTGCLPPSDCDRFGRQCTPDHPCGALMVSTEGACAAYYRGRASCRGQR